MSIVNPFKKKHSLPGDLLDKVIDLGDSIGLSVDKTILRACAVLKDITDDIDDSILKLAEISMGKKNIPIKTAHKEVFLNVLASELSSPLPTDEPVLIYLRSDNILVVDSHIIQFSQEGSSLMSLGVSDLLESGRAISVPIWLLADFPKLLSSSKDFRKKVFRKRTLHNRIESLRSGEVEGSEYSSRLELMIEKSVGISVN